MAYIDTRNELCTKLKLLCIVLLSFFATSQNLAYFRELIWLLERLDCKIKQHGREDNILLKIVSVVHYLKLKK